MKLLIVTANFHPFAHPRAHRWTEIAAHWAAAGHEAHVVTARFPGEKSRSTHRGATVHRAGFASLKEAFNFFFPKKIDRGELASPVRGWGGANRLTRLLAFLNDVFWRPFYWPDDAALWYFPARRLCRSLFLEEKFDAFVTVSMPFTGHLVGLFLKKKFPQAVWLADIGDPINFQRFPLQNPFFYRKRTLFYEKKVLEMADLVCVTNAALARVYEKQFGIEPGKIVVLPPVASMEQPPPAPPEGGRNNPTMMHFSPPLGGLGGASLAFFGTFFRGVREPDILTEMMATLPEEWREKLPVHVFGPIFHEFEKKLADRSGIVLHGMLPRREALLAMQSADFLINIGNTEAHQLPSKLADYVLSGKPIINLCQIENDSFAEATADHPLVFNLKKEDGEFSESSIERLINFTEKNRGARLPESYLAEKKQFFSAERISEEYIRLIEKAISEKRAIGNR